MSTTKEIMVRPTFDQAIEWSEAAGGEPLDGWLAELADAAVSKGKEPAWPVVVTLKHPVEHGSQTITTLEVRRGQLGYLKNVKLGGDEMSADQLIIVASRMCGQPTQVIEKLAPVDAGEVMPLVLSFFTTCLRGGKRR